MKTYSQKIDSNIKNHGNNYYSLYDMGNITRCKVDSEYLGEVMLVNEYLIWHSVHKYIGKPEMIEKNYKVDKDDVLQLGRLGFFKSIMAFDIYRGVKFSSFAVTAIVREIKSYLRDSSCIIRPTRTANDLMNRIGRLEQQLGYLPSPEDLAIMLDSDEEKVKKALKIGKTVKYLDEPAIHNNSGGANEVVTHLDLIKDEIDVEEYVVDKVIVDGIVDEISDSLTDKESAVLKARLAGYSQTEVAELMDISPIKVSRIIKKVQTIMINLGYAR